MNDERSLSLDEIGEIFSAYVDMGDSNTAFVEVPLCHKTFTCGGLREEGSRAPCLHSSPRAALDHFASTIKNHLVGKQRIYWRRRPTLHTMMLHEPGAPNETIEDWYFVSCRMLAI